MDGADYDLVAPLEQVDEAGLHAGHAGGADREGQPIGGLECLAQHVLRFIHDLQEIGIEVADERHGHGREHARMHVTGSGAEEKTLGGT